MNPTERPVSTRPESAWDGIEAIVFDAVGTLIDPSPPVADVYAQAALRQGVSLDLALVKRRFHQHFRRDEVDEARGPLVTDETLERRRWRRIVASVLAEVPDHDRAFIELWDHFGRADSWSCFSDVGPTLRWFRDRGLPIRIASNFDARLRAVVAGLPALSGLEEWLIISSEVGYRKPHPIFFEAVSRSLNLPPQRILCVGDDVENDVGGANWAGMRAVLLDRHGNEPPAGTAAVSDLSALLAHCRR